MSRAWLVYLDGDEERGVMADDERHAARAAGQAIYERRTRSVGLTPTRALKMYRSGRATVGTVIIVPEESEPTDDARAYAYEVTAWLVDGPGIYGVDYDAVEVSLPMGGVES